MGRGGGDFFDAEVAEMFELPPVIAASSKLSNGSAPNGSAVVPRQLEVVFAAEPNTCETTVRLVKCDKRKMTHASSKK